jgi:hypothetical protein
MNRQNISQIIRELFRENVRLYPEDYKVHADAINMAKESAKSYWDNRNEIEIERDNEAKVTLQDYESWCLAELEELKGQQA